MDGLGAARPFPPGEYGVVVVGSGPGGLQTSYALRRLGVDHAVISADEAPGGMFRRLPRFERLISWTKPDAPYDRTTREYEWYDHNSLVGDEPEHRATVPEQMDRTFVVPSRAEMEAGLAAFAERGGVRVRYGCRWESTRRADDGSIVLGTSDGEYRCRAVVFALGVTEPWLSPLPGIEHVPHYVETRSPRSYAGRDVIVIGKRNSGFEVADALLPWARRIMLVSPRPVETAVLALATVRARYLQPYEDHAYGGGTFAVDAAVDRIERTERGYRVVAHGTTRPGELVLEADDAIAATGFRTPLGDLTALGVATVSHGRIPALTPFWESVSTPDVFFAGNATQGARGLGKHGIAGTSAAVHGFRYNARVLADHLAARYFGLAPERRRLRRDAVVPLLLDALACAPELWAQKGYLARVVTLDGEGARDGAIVPLEHFVDESGPDAAAATVEMDGDGRIFPTLYIRRDGRLREEQLDGDALNRFADEHHRARLEALLAIP